MFIELNRILISIEDITFHITNVSLISHRPWWITQNIETKPTSRCEFEFLIGDSMKIACWALLTIQWCFFVIDSEVRFSSCTKQFDGRWLYGFNPNAKFNFQPLNWKFVTISNHDVSRTFWIDWVDQCFAFKPHIFPQQ